MWALTDAAFQYNPEEGTQFLWNCKRGVKTPKNLNVTSTDSAALTQDLRLNLSQPQKNVKFKHQAITDLINMLPGNSAVNTVQHTTEEAAFSVDLTDPPIDWLDSDHVICVYCRSMSVLRLHE
jgi:hypothetical protein